MSGVKVVLKYIVLVPQIRISHYLRHPPILNTIIWVACPIQNNDEAMLRVLTKKRGEDPGFISQESVIENFAVQWAPCSLRF